MRFPLSALVLSALVAGPATADPRVVATLQPVALIAEALTGEKPAVPADGGSGHEHGGSLRPSDARALADADLVLWVGPALEPGVAAALPDGADALALDSVGGLARRDGPGGPPDAHIWLDPANALAMARAAAAPLAALDPPVVAPDEIAANLESLGASLAATTERVAARMAPLVDRPYAVEHDAFRHFTRAFGLAEPLALGAALGARSLRTARERVATLGITCLVVEPGEPSRLAAALGDDVRAVVIDPLGRDATDPADLIERVAAGFEECLGG